MSTATPRYAVGIDLGTTNSALAYVDLGERPRRLTVLPIAQLVAAGSVAARPTLPSFLYLPGEHELPAGATALPFGDGAATGQAPIVVGEWARTQGALLPGRLISSAKSWLCHPAVDRQAAILPWAAAPEVLRRSPVDASAAYLRHLGAVFHAATGTALGDADVILTVPASFDEVARELTVEAAVRAGLPRVVLLEEPQAAFYDFLGKTFDAGQGGQARAGERKGRTKATAGATAATASAIAPGQSILVCDIGGGTTDFSIIRALPPDEGSRGQPRFERTAVGDHLLLGGDNMDLALARRVEKRLPSGEKLDAARFQSLLFACRVAKEKLLADAPSDVAVAETESLAGGPAATERRQRWTLHIAGRRSLIGGGTSVELTLAEVEEAIVDGFFPLVAADAEPSRSAGLGLREFGLPYESDAAVTRHLARFLRRHGVSPDAILFNGGVLHSGAIRERIVAAVGRITGRVPSVLANDAPDLAVARGAAYYALARRGDGLRIRGGAARAYYIEVETAGEGGDTRVDEGTVNALCVAARGGEDSGATEAAEISGREFEVVTNRPVRFRLMSSSDRSDAVGDLLRLPVGALADLPPIVTVLRFSRSSQDFALKVRLRVERTELGTLDLHLLSPPPAAQRYKLAFDLRGVEQPTGPAPGSPAGGHAEERRSLARFDGAPKGGVSENSDHESEKNTSEKNDAGREGAAGGAVVAAEKIAAAEELVRRVFDKGHAQPVAPAQAMKELCAVLGLERGEWPTPALRALWEPCKALRGQRGRTVEHEARWLNLVGYCLRPGYGYALDDWRVKEAWRLFNAGLVNDKDPRCRLEWWILWRRTSGGLTRTMQDELGKRIFPHFLDEPGKKRAEKKTPPWQEAAEMWRVAGSLERIPAIEKWKLGEKAIEAVEKAERGEKEKHADREPVTFALGRLGARVPLYGPIENVVSAKRAEKWVERLLAIDFAGDSSRLGHSPLAFAAATIARASGDRARDLDEGLRKRLASRLASVPNGAHLSRLVLEPSALEAGEERFAFGEALPVGLRLSSTEGRGAEDQAGS